VAEAASTEVAEPTIAVPRLLRSVPTSAPDPEDEPAADEPELVEADQVGADSVEADSLEVDAVEDGDEPAAVAEEPSELDTLHEFLEGDGYTEDSVRVYAGLSDAAAVPDTATSAGWEPAIVVNYPVEPSQLDDADLVALDGLIVEDPERPDEVGLPGTDEPGPPDPIVEFDGRREEADELEEEHAHPPVEPVPTPRPAKAAKRKRASVPSWDEIMFGGPKRS
jgi:hypothetical protein